MVVFFEGIRVYYQEELENTPAWDKRPTRILAGRAIAQATRYGINVDFGESDDMPEFSSQSVDTPVAVAFDDDEQSNVEKTAPNAEIETKAQAEAEAKAQAEAEAKAQAKEDLITQHIEGEWEEFTETYEAQYNSFVADTAKLNGEIAYAADESFRVWLKNHNHTFADFNEARLAKAKRFINEFISDNAQLDLVEKKAC